MYQLLAYINFLFNSTNHHGVHSPFIYGFVTQCLYSKSSQKQPYSKTEKLIFKLVNYFNFKSVLIVNDASKQKSSVILKVNPSIKIKGVENFSTLKTPVKAKPYDCIIIDEKFSEIERIHFLEHISTYCHNDTVLIYTQPYQSKTRFEIWQILKHNHLVTVTVDGFNLGFVFFRKEQAKEHFKIRL